MDPKDGKVLALTNPDWAIRIRFPPGSTFKLVTALAALSRGQFNQFRTVACPGYHIFQGETLNCSHAHGEVNLTKGLAYSCNTYFYALGESLGWKPTADCACSCGLDALTGINNQDTPPALCSGRGKALHRFGAAIPLGSYDRALIQSRDGLLLIRDGRRLSQVKILGSWEQDVSGEAFRSAGCKALGWNTIKSTWFTIHRQKGRLVLVGRGFGHGVGMCQNGARARALAGETYREIIEAYFPGVTVEKQ